MPPPSKKQQIDAVVGFLASDRNEGRSLEEIAKEIVEGYHEMLMAGIKKPATPLRTGMLLKSPWDAKVRRVAWMDHESAWIVGETSSYGWLGPLLPAAWEYCEEYNPKTRKEIEVPCGSAGTEGHVCEPSHTIKGRMVEMTEEEIAEAWSNPDWKVGDQLSQRQRQFNFTVIATGPQCVLMRQNGGPLAAESNAALAKHYRRETKQESDW